MNEFLRVHEDVDGAAGPETLGYYTRGDLPFYYSLADAFTICDAYHCSVIGPTDPNRVMSMSATIDPAGTHGGPILKTNVSSRSDRFSWTTMPERLSAHGVSWKVYTAGNGGVLDNVLTFDHTSTLRFLERRFGVEVPNLSAWRRQHTGDLTGAFNFAASPNTSRPRLPHVNAVGQCTTAPPATVPVQPFPKQEKGRRRRPSGIVR